MKSPNSRRNRTSLKRRRFAAPLLEKTPPFCKLQLPVPNRPLAAARATAANLLAALVEAIGVTPTICH